MAKCNKVCSNLQQDFDNTEKKQARTNIDASQIQYVNATPGHQPTSEVGDLFVVEYESGKHFNDGDGNIGGLVPEPTSGTVGNVSCGTQSRPVPAAAKLTCWLLPTTSTVTGITRFSVSSLSIRTLPAASQSCRATLRATT